MQFMWNERCVYGLTKAAAVNVLIVKINVFIESSISDTVLSTYCLLIGCTSRNEFLIGRPEGQCILCKGITT